MARLIEVQLTPGCPTSLTTVVGDVLQFAASGGHVRSGSGTVEMLGPFRTAMLGENGQILTPAGGPNVVFFLARLPGHATINVVSGDPWHAPKNTAFEIVVVS
jgi:hypothetical protein